MQAKQGAHQRRFVPALMGLLMVPLAGLSTLPTQAHAGAWTPEPGASYHKFAINSFVSKGYFGTAPPQFGEFTDRNLSYYGEYGLREGLALFGTLPFKRLSSTDSAGLRTSHTGVGDVELGLRWRHLGGPTVVSTQWLFKAPWAYSDNASVAPGNGQVDLEGRVLVGRSLGKAGYVGIEAGLRARFGAPADEFRYLLEYGGDISSNLYARGKLDGIRGLGNSSGTSVTTAGNPGLNLEFDLLKLELTAGVKVSRSVSMEFSATRHLQGQNALRGTNFSLALVHVY